VHILVVEDETMVAEMLSRALEQLGNSCVVAANTAAAEAVLEETSVDAVTLDLTMPGRDGLSWLEGMAGLRPDLAKKTLVITGRPLEPPAVERLARCGAGLLAKPFTLDSLKDAVRAQLDHANVKN
jgi:two-component system OmpR family response regulator